MIFNNYEKEVRIIEQLIWHLGNVLGSRDITDIIIENKIFDKVYDLLNRQAINEKIVKISVWFIANVAKLKLFDNQIVLDKCVQILMLFIKTDDIELLSDCLWGLSYVSETENKELIEYMISERLSEYLFMLNLDGRDNLILPVIRVTGNLLSNESNYVDTLIKQGCIKYLDQFISHQNNQIRRESLWAISNIAGGTNSQLSALLQSNIIQKIFSLVKDPDSDVVNEVMWCIGNILNSSNIENCVKLVDMNVFEPILYILSNFLNPATLILCISALSKLLEHGKYSGYHHDYNPFVKIFSEKGGLEIIDKLQYHKNEKIYALVSNLLDNYFSDFITKINDPI